MIEVKRTTALKLVFLLFASLIMGPVVLAGVEVSGQSPKEIQQQGLEKKKRLKRSLLFYLIDTCRADRMSVYGAKRKTTPFLESLASKSVVFDNCYSQAPWTKPSMAAILSSRYPSETGVHNLFQNLPLSITTFPEVLQESGYFTIGFSTNPLMGSFSSFDQGFIEFVESSRIKKGDPIRFASGSAKLMNQHTFSWLDKTDYWPMFIYMHSVDPHEEYEPDQRYLKKFADPMRMNQYRKDWKALSRTRRRSLANLPTAVHFGNHLTRVNFQKAGVEVEPFIQQGLSLYDADILANDDQLKRLWEKLQEDGWGEDIILVVTADHGEEFFEHGGTSHGYSLYNEMIHVPLIIYAPGLIPAGKRISQLVETIDIYPTLLELLNIEPPKDIKGRSLVPLIKDPESWKNRPAFAEVTEDPMDKEVGETSGSALSVITGPWKFILNFKSPTNLERPRYELYKLDEDPNEMNNLAKKHKKMVVRFEKQIRKRSALNHNKKSVFDGAVPDSIDPEVLEQLHRLGYIR